MRRLLRAVEIQTAFFAAVSCGRCGRDCSQEEPFPAVYTLASIEGLIPPVPICDRCVARLDPQLFDRLVDERRQFFGL